MGTTTVSTRSIGLDIGTFAVRAAEVSVDKGEVTLERFGQVTLPPNAVIAGEVQDPDVVGEAIAKLWKQVNFSSTKVVLGIGGTRVILRQVDFPVMPLEELREAMNFEADDLIPIPLEEAYLDFDVIGETIDEEGQAHSQILLAAAHRSVVDSAMEAARVGGLHPMIVDPTPLAMVRALATADADSWSTDQAEALLGVGEGVTVFVVHHEGVPRFVRLSSHGGGEVTALLSRELGVGEEEAESAKRQLVVDSSLVPLGTANTVARAVGIMTDDVRGTIDFYGSQPGALPISRIVVTGGGSRTPGVMAALSAAVSEPIERSNLMERLHIGHTGISGDMLAYAEPLLAVPVGIALAGTPGLTGHINLLPAHIIEERRERNQMAAVGGALGVAALALGGVWALHAHDLAAHRQQLATHEAQVASLQTQKHKYDSVAATEASIATGSSQVKSSLYGQVDWSNVLTQVTGAMPSSVWLTSFTGTAPTATTPGTVAVGVMGLGQKSTAAWLTQEAAAPSLSNVYVTASTRPQVGQPVTVASTADLNSAAQANQAQNYLGGGAGS